MLPPFLEIRLLKASPCGRGGAVRRRRGAKKYQISLFFRTVEDACPYNLWIFCSLRLNALCTQNLPLWKFLRSFFQKATTNTIAYHGTNAERTMCAKIFQYESFCGAFFKKRPINIINSCNNWGRGPPRPYGKRRCQRRRNERFRPKEYRSKP